MHSPRCEADIDLEDEFAFGPGGKARVDDVDEDAEDVKALRASMRLVPFPHRKNDTKSDKKLPGSLRCQLRHPSQLISTDAACVCSS